MNDYKRFAREEYEERWANARGLMREKGIDAMFIMGGSNFIYFSGGLRDITLCRPGFMLLPMDGEPVVLVQWCNKENQTRTCQVKDFRYYRELGYAPIAMLEDIFREKGLQSARVGAELGREQPLGISYSDFVSLGEKLPHVQFVDVAEIVWGLRMVKSKAEIERIRMACKIQNEAYLEVLNTIRPDMTERQVTAMFLRLLSEKGGESPWAMINSNPRNYSVYGETINAPDAKLTKGNTLWMDGGCSYQNYWCDFTIMAMIGTPSARQKKMYEQTAEIEKSLIASVRPGVKVADLDRLNSQKYKEIGIDYMATDVGGGRIGHGLGLGGTEPPHIAAYDNTVLKANMVITIEPGFVTDYGYFQIEEDILVTEKGSELLSDVTRRMWII